MPPAPAAPRHPDFLYPTVPPGTDSIQTTRIERGWRYLQADNFRGAERDFAAALKLQPSFHPAAAGLGYVALAQRNPKEAVAAFDRALESDAAYLPALIGRANALLELKRDAEALANFEAALKADPTRTELRSRIDVLRFRAVQASLARAQAASDAGRWDEARAAYEQAIAASPESAFLYRDLAMVERKAGQPALALEHFRKAAALDPSDARSQAQIAAILEEQGDLEGALAAYDTVRRIDPSEVDAAAVARLRERVAYLKLPAEYRAIPESPTVTRAEMAALVAVRLAPLLDTAAPRQVVITDLRNHWALPWIQAVVRAGVMDTQPNYTFQPALRVRRGDVAQTVARILNLIAARNPARAKAWQSARPKISDVPPTHLSYASVAQAVASGVMPLENGAFSLLRTVTGAEAMEIIARLEALARP